MPLAVPQRTIDRTLFGLKGWSALAVLPTSGSAAAAGWGGSAHGRRWLERAPGTGQAHNVLCRQAAPWAAQRGGCMPVGSPRFPPASPELPAGLPGDEHLVWGPLGQVDALWLEAGHGPDLAWGRRQRRSQLGRVGVCWRQRR